MTREIKNKYLKIRVTNNFKEQLETEASVLGLSLSEYLRFILIQRSIPASVEKQENEDIDF